MDKEYIKGFINHLLSLQKEESSHIVLAKIRSSINEIEQIVVNPKEWKRVAFQMDQDGNEFEATEWRSVIGNITFSIPEINSFIEHIDDPRATLITAAMFSLYFNKTAESVVDLDPRHNIGWSAKRLMRTIHPEGDPHGVEKRFMRLLDSDIDHMLINLTWFVQMFRLYHITVNWYRFMADLSEWEEESYKPLSKSVRTQWSRMFWGQPVASKNKENTNTANR